MCSASPPAAHAVDVSPWTSRFEIVAVSYISYPYDVLPPEARTERFPSPSIQFTLAHGLVVSPYLSPDLDLPHRASHHRCVQFIVSCTYDPEQPVALALSPLRPPPGSSCAPRLRWPGLTLAGADACRTGCGGRPCIITLFTYRAFVPFICAPDSDTADPPYRYSLWPYVDAVATYTYSRYRV